MCLTSFDYINSAWELGTPGSSHAEHLAETLADFGSTRASVLEHRNKSETNDARI